MATESNLLQYTTSLYSYEESVLMIGEKTSKK